MNTAELTIQLPKNKIDFLKTYAETHGVTISELIDGYIGSPGRLRKSPIHPDIVKITGVIPRNIDVREECIARLMEKHS